MSEALPAEKGAITNVDAPEGTTVTQEAPSKPVSSNSKPVSRSKPSSKPPSKASAKPVSKSKPAATVTASAGVVDKGKGKRTASEADFDERNAREKKRIEAKAVADRRAARDEDEEEADEEEEEEEDDEDDGEGEDESDEEVEETFEEIDPSAIRSRRTRGVKVDYTSPEALAKAGLNPGDDDDN